MATRTTIAHADLCAGVGGFSLALHLVYGARVRPVVFVEREVYAVSTLMARMADKTLPEAPVWDDLETFDGKPWRGKVDILTAGFPCPPFSVAGKRKGTDDDRWLWPEIARIICEMGGGTIDGPAVLWMENVPGLALSNELEGQQGWYLPSGLWHVLRDLAVMGFDAIWGMLPASTVGASHRRKRIYIVAYARCFQSLSGSVEVRSGSSEEPGHEENDRPGDGGNELGNSARDNQRRHTDRTHRPRQSTGGSGGEVANTGCAGNDAKQSQLEPECGDATGIGSSVSKLDLTEGSGQQKLRSASAPRGRRRHSDQSDQDVANSTEQRTRPVSKRSRNSGNGAGDVDRPGDELDHSERQGLEGYGRHGDTGDESRRIGAGEDGPVTPSGIPLFPPGPGLFMPGVIDDLRDTIETDPRGTWARYCAELSNTVDWYNILEIDQTLEPAVRRVANELPEGLDKLLWSARVDRIRAMGNAIVPTAAALAYLILSERLGVEL